MTNAIVAKATVAKTAQVKEMALMLINDHQDGADIVLDAVLSILEARLTEGQFVSFCEELEAAMA